MVDKLFITLLVSAHFVGDWWFQSRWMATNKSSNKSVLLQHILIVTAFISIPVLFYVPFTQAVLLLIVNGILHGLIDWNIWRGYKSKVPTDFEYWKDKRFYDTIASDQLLHIVILLILFA